MAWIDQNLENFIREEFPDRIVRAYHAYRTWQSNRYVWVTTILKDQIDLHYEYYQDHVELHLEGKYQSDDYRSFVKELRVKTARNPDLTWSRWQGHNQCRCTLHHKTGSWEELLSAFHCIMSVFDPIIKEISEKRSRDISTDAYSGMTSFQEKGLEDDNVSLETCSLGQLFSNSLIIPDYQRNYCWEEKQVRDLWQSLKDVPIEGKYHLGTIILQKDCHGNYAVIDGQQRLVTLTLICRELGYKGEMPLLTQTFRSAASRQHVANNRFQIEQYCSRSHDEKLCGKLINNLIFSVLILKDSRLDLAYTFFSNENSKGVPLTDYDLLKAHHLRFVFNERQAEHLANKWNSMTSLKYRQLDATLSAHLFRLRKWMRKRDYNAAEKHRTKEEFSSALIIPEIPPFGEQFEYYEKIQGGTHFFAYAEHFVGLFERFEQTKQVVALRRHLQWESHPRYEEVIETLLFGYFLKFGTQYLAEALFCIAGYIAQHRYSSRRALSYKIREFAKNSEIVMMIDQASSPTFFLAECLTGIKLSGKDIDEQGIELRFYQRLQDMFTEINEDFTDYTIIVHYNNEYA